MQCAEFTCLDLKVFFQGAVAGTIILRYRGRSVGGAQGQAAGVMAWACSVAGRPQAPSALVSLVDEIVHQHRSHSSTSFVRLSTKLDQLLRSDTFSLYHNNLRVSGATNTMSTLEELDDLDRRDKDDQKRHGRKAVDKNGDEDADMNDATAEEDILDEEILGLSTQDIETRRRLLENDSRIMKSELSRLSHEKAAMGEKIKDNVEKIANNRLV